MPSTTTVSEAMTAHPITIGLDDSLRDVQALFHLHAFHHLIVVHAGEVMGVLSDRDLLRSLSPFAGSLSEQDRDARQLDRRVHQVMTRQPMTVREMTTLADAARVMLELRVSCVPVVDGVKRPVGILTSRDLLSWTLDRLLDRAGPSGLPRAA